MDTETSSLAPLLLPSAHSGSDPEERFPDGLVLALTMPGMLVVVKI